MNGAGCMTLQEIANSEYYPNPYVAPRPIKGEVHDRYLERLASSFEAWVNQS